MNRPPSTAVWEFLMRIIILQLWSVSQGRLVSPETPQGILEMLRYVEARLEFSSWKPQIWLWTQAIISMNRPPSRALWEFLMRMIILSLFKCLAVGRFIYPDTLWGIPKCSEVEFPAGIIIMKTSNLTLNTRNHSQWIVLQAELFENF